MNPIIGFRSIIHAAQKVSHTQRRRGIRAQDPIKAQKLRFKIEISVNVISNWIKNSSSSERKKMGSCNVGYKNNRRTEVVM